jgi:hypothetical protein
MTSTGRRVGVIAAWTAAAVLALGAAAGAATVAFADPTPTPSPSSSADAKTDRPDRGDRPNAGKHGFRGFVGRHALRGGALHGEFVIKNKDGKFVTMLSQRGEVTAVDSDSITLKSEDGFTKTYTINGDTRIRSDREKAKIGDVKVGANAAVVAEKSGDGGTAKIVIARTQSDSD